MAIILQWIARMANTIKDTHAGFWCEMKTKVAKIAMSGKKPVFADHLVEQLSNKWVKNIILKLLSSQRPKYKGRYTKKNSL